MDFDSFLNRTEGALGIDRLPNSARSTIWKAFGIALIVGALLIFQYQPQTDSRITNGIFGALTKGGSVLAGYGGAILYIRGRRVAASAGVDSRPIVLYLRSFRDDAKLALPLSTSLPFLPSLSPEEEQLALGFQPIGPLKGIGIPNERLAPLGATREYLADDKWKERVRELMDASRLIVLRVGDTSSLLWELALVVQAARPEKLVLLVADKLEYEGFRKISSPPLPKPLPDYELRKPQWTRASQPATTVRALVYFSADWSPHFVWLLAPRWRAGKPVARALIDAMRPVYEQLNLVWSPPDVSWPKIIGALATVIAGGWVVFVGLSEPRQLSCNENSSDYGRATLNANLQPESRRNCCSNYPWLAGC